MSKINLDTVTSGFLSQEALNNNFEAIQEELQSKVLYRDNPNGEPNSMENDLDMNGHRILNQLGEGGDGFIWKRSWETGLSYEINNLVYVPSGTYDGYTMICTEDHTASALFLTDYDAGKWEVVAAKGASGAGSGDLISTNNLSDVASNVTALSNLGGMPKTGGTFTGDIIVPDETYGSGWNGNLEAPTKNAVYDKIESLGYPIRLNNSSETLNASAMNKTTVIALACTKTLPLLSTVTDGQVIGFQMNDNVVVTIQRQGSDELSFGEITAFNSIKMAVYGEHLYLIADKASSRWRVVSENIRPAFSATYTGAGQTLDGTNVRTRLQFNTESTDTHEFYDPTTNFRFTPLIPGWYQVNLNVYLSGGTQTRVEALIFKNGAYNTCSCGLKSGSSDGNFVVSALVRINGSGDYIEAWSNGIDANVVFSAARPPIFTAVRVA